MVRVAFCDDDLSILQDLNVLIDKYRLERNRDIEYTAFRSPLELIAEIERGVRFDILFLDVIMPGENGIEAAKEIRKYDEGVKIIFLTSSSEFAVQSYSVNARFYQLKPIWEEGFFRLMDSVTEECRKEQENSLILRCKTGITKIDLGRLMYSEVLRRTLFFYMDDGKVLESSGSMDELWERLEGNESFMHPHRSFLVNMEYIRNITYKAILMENQAQIPIPHGKYSEIKNRYLEYAFSRKQVFMT